MPVEKVFFFFIKSPLQIIAFVLSECPVIMPNWIEECVYMVETYGHPFIQFVVDQGISPAGTCQNFGICK